VRKEANVSGGYIVESLGTVFAGEGEEKLQAKKVAWNSTGTRIAAVWEDGVVRVWKCSADCSLVRID